MPQKGREWHEEYVGNYPAGKFRTRDYAFDDERLLADAALARVLADGEVPEQAGASDSEIGGKAEQQPVVAEDPEQSP